MLFPEAAVQRCLKKRCIENMQQTYRRTPMAKCDFNKVEIFGPRNFLYEIKIM